MGNTIVNNRGPRHRNTPEPDWMKKEEKKPALGSFLKVAPTSDGKFRLLEVSSTGQNAPHMKSLAEFMARTEDHSLVDQTILKMFIEQGFYEKVVVEDKTSRTPTQIAQHAQEVGSVVNELFEKNGFVFKGEHLKDASLKEKAIALISNNFLVEGVGEEKEVAFRRIHNNGLLSKRFTVDEILRHYTWNLLDEKRTEAKREEQKLAIREQLSKKPDHRKETMAQQRRASVGNNPDGSVAKKLTIDEEVDEVYKASQKVYTNRALPAYDETVFKRRFEDEAVAKLGLTKWDKTTSSRPPWDRGQRSQVETYISKKIESLNSLHGKDDLQELWNYKSPTENWDGLAK